MEVGQRCRQWLVSGSLCRTQAASPCKVSAHRILELLLEEHRAISLCPPLLSIISAPTIPVSTPQPSPTLRSQETSSPGVSILDLDLAQCDLCQAVLADKETERKL